MILFILRSASNLTRVKFFSTIQREWKEKLLKGWKSVSRSGELLTLLFSLFCTAILFMHHLGKFSCTKLPGTLNQRAFQWRFTCVIKIRWIQQAPWKKKRSFLSEWNFVTEIDDEFPLSKICLQLNLNFFLMKTQFIKFNRGSEFFLRRQTFANQSNKLPNKLSLWQQSLMWLISCGLYSSVILITFFSHLLIVICFVRKMRRKLIFFRFFFLSIFFFNYSFLSFKCFLHQSFLALGEAF